MIAVIAGTAGVGKTALALHWAHQVSARFPDGQLYVNLRGYDPARPVAATDALAGFLRALGVGGQDIPAGQDERAARYRSLLADTRMLVILDNAASEEHVRPLLPGTPGCAVVVTSRDSLAGLVARDGAHRLDLDLLPLNNAVGLLRELVGERADADPHAVAALAAQCCRLPLALRVAAELTAARRDAPLAALVDELANQHQRLDLFDAGRDPHTALRTVLSWSYRHLDVRTARAYRLAALHPGSDLDPYAVAALTDASLEQGRSFVEVLARAHLIHRARAGRYGMHGLLRAYARELAAAHDGAGQQHAALTRLFDHYLYTAAAAMNTLHPAGRDSRPRIPPPATPVPPVTDPPAALAWLDAERDTLVAVSAHTAGHGWPSHATRLSATLFRHLDAGSRYPEAITIHTHARDAARRTGDRAAEATALNHLAGPDRRQGRYQLAGHHALPPGPGIVPAERRPHRPSPRAKLSFATSATPTPIRAVTLPPLASIHRSNRAASERVNVKGAVHAGLAPAVVHLGERPPAGGGEPAAGRAGSSWLSSISTRCRNRSTGTASRAPGSGTPRSRARACWSAG